MPPLAITRPKMLPSPLGDGVGHSNHDRSTTNSRRRSGRIPRATRSSSRAVVTVAFSEAPLRTPSTYFFPSSSTPTAARTWFGAIFAEVVHLRSGLQFPCLRFATAVTGRHARLGTRLLARLCRGCHFRRLCLTSFQGELAAAERGRLRDNLVRTERADFPHSALRKLIHSTASACSSRCGRRKRGRCNGCLAFIW